MHDLDRPFDGTPPRLDLIACNECGRLWLDPSERWRVYVLYDEVPEAVPYCADCAAREFG